MACVEKFLKFKVGNIETLLFVSNEIKDPNFNSKILVDGLKEEYDTKIQTLQTLKFKLEEIKSLKKFNQEKLREEVNEKKKSLIKNVIINKIYYLGSIKSRSKISLFWRCNWFKIKYSMKRFKTKYGIKILIYL